MFVLVLRWMRISKSQGRLWCAKTEGQALTKWSLRLIWGLAGGRPKIHSLPIGCHGGLFARHWLTRPGPQYKSSQGSRWDLRCAYRRLQRFRSDFFALILSSHTNLWQHITEINNVEIEIFQKLTLLKMEQRIPRMKMYNVKGLFHRC